MSNIKTKTKLHLKTFEKKHRLRNFVLFLNFYNLFCSAYRIAMQLKRELLGYFGYFYRFYH